MRHPNRPSFTARSARALASLSVPAALACSAALTGCSGDEGTPPVQPPDGDTVVLTQANNYTAESSLKIPVVPTAAGEDLSICWDKIAKDIQCHDVDPGVDVDDVTLILVNNPDTQEVSDLLDTGEFESGDSKGTFEFQPPDSSTTCASLADFTDIGDNKPINVESDYAESSTVSYLMVFQTGTKLGQGAKSMLFLKPGGSSGTDVNAVANDKCDMLDFTAHLGTPVGIPKDGPWLVDWKGVKNDSQGVEINISAITRILVGFYKDRDASALEDGFLNLEQKTPEEGGPELSWELEVPSGQSANLGNGVGRNGEGEFAGFDSGGDEGTWIMGLFCDTCKTPAPPIVVVVDPK